MNTQTSFADSLLSGIFSGVQMPENAHSVNELLDKYGLNWTVSKQRLTLPSGIETPFFGIVRDDKNYTTYAINRSSELLAAIASEMRQKGETMWGLMSGVTNYTTHTMPVPKRDNARLESLYTGTGYQVNNDAFALVKAAM